MTALERAAAHVLSTTVAEAAAADAAEKARDAATAADEAYLKARMVALEARNQLVRAATGDES